DRVEAVGVDRVRGYPQGGDGPGVEDEAAAAVELDSGGARAVHGDGAGSVDGAVAVHRDALAGVAIAGDGGAGVHLDAVVVADDLYALGAVDPSGGGVERAGTVVGAVGGERASYLDHVAVAGDRDRVGVVASGHDAGTGDDRDVARRQAGVGPVALDANAVGAQAAGGDGAEQGHVTVRAPGEDAVRLLAGRGDAAAGLDAAAIAELEHQAAGLGAAGGDVSEVEQPRVAAGNVQAMAAGAAGGDVALARQLVAVAVGAHARGVLAGRGDGSRAHQRVVAVSRKLQAGAERAGGGDGRVLDADAVV